MHPHKFLLWVAMGSLIMMFAGLTSAFIVKSNQVGWKSVTLPSVFWFSTLAIVLSSGSVQLALRCFREREMARYRVWVGVTLVLGILFVVLQWNGFSNLWDQQITFRGSGAGQFLYVIFGLHALHVVGGVVALSRLLAIAFFGRIKIYSSVPVELAAMYWHFVDLLWIYLLLFFLLIGGN
jgi:cytochrome c oxidase subunit 3